MAYPLSPAHLRAKASRSLRVENIPDGRGRNDMIVRNLRKRMSLLGESGRSSLFSRIFSLTSLNWLGACTGVYLNKVLIRNYCGFTSQKVVHAVSEQLSAHILSYDVIMSVQVSGWP
jgi:hypothetical protein